MNNFIYGVCVAAGTDPESGATRLIVEVPAHALRDGPAMVYRHVRVALNECLTCMGKGILHTGIMESPTTVCHACSGLGHSKYPGDPMTALLEACRPAAGEDGWDHAQYMEFKAAFAKADAALARCKGDGA